MGQLSQKSNDGFTFRCYHLDDGADAIRTWLGAIGDGADGAMEAVIDNLQRVPRKFWRGRQYRALGQGGQVACAGLIRLRVGDTTYRVLGYEGPGENTVTLLYGFNKDDDPDYSKSCPEAAARRDKVEANNALSRQCRF